MKADPRLFDTDVLVDYLRGYAAAAELLENCTGPMLVSVITAAELYAGSRDTRDRVALGEFLEAFVVLPVDAEIARAGGILRGRFRGSHGTGLADALIAATADRHDAVLVTLNRKHYPMVTRLEVPYVKRS